jgi:hypothetical protein
MDIFLLWNSKVAMYLAIMGKCHVNGFFHLYCMVFREYVQEFLCCFVNPKGLLPSPSHWILSWAIFIDLCVIHPSDVAVLVKASVCNSVECRCDALQDVTLEWVAVWTRMWGVTGSYLCLEAGSLDWCFPSSPRWMQLWGIHIHALKEYLNLCNKCNQCTCKKYVLSHGINYQHVSLAFVIIIRIVLQKYQECNKLPNCIGGTA